jgi:DNA mismatch repair protein MutS
MGIVTEYLKYQEEYQEKYGIRTIVLYQNGTFYEIFEYDPERNEESEIPPWPTKKIGHATELSKLLGYTLTKRNKNKPYSLSNPNMIGFPCVAYDKHKDILLSKDYTIIVVEQDKPGKNSVRKVTQVLSPATEIGDLSPIPVSNQIVSIYIEVQKESPKLEDYLITIGMSTVDVTTGSNIVGEIYSKNSDAIYGLHELYRFLLTIQPRELIISIHGVKKETAEQYKDYVTTSMELSKYPLYVVRVNSIDGEYLKSTYHQQFLSKVFSPEPTVFNNVGNLRMNIIQTNNTVIKRDNHIVLEELGLERMHYGTISYILLLQYCYEHNELLIEKLRKPDTRWIDEHEHLITTHNALQQLDVIPPPGTTQRSGINSLLSVVNNTSTSLGRRFLQQMLCNPITNPIQINEYYDMTQIMIDKPDLLKTIEDHLKKVPDLDRYQRKLQLGVIKPNEFVTLFRGYINIVNLYTIILQSNTDLSKLLFTQVNDFNECLTTVLSKYNLDILNTATLDNNGSGHMTCDESIFYVGTDNTSDKYSQSIKEYIDKLGCIVTHLNSHLSSTRGKLIELPTKKDVGLYTTIHKGNVLKSAPIDITLCGNIQITTINKDSMITSDVISSICQNLSHIRDQYNQYLYRCYKTTINTIGKYDFFHDINIFVSRLDYIKSNAKTAIKNNYHRPEIIEADISKLEIKEMRHPVAERLIDSLYVTNDLSLGIDSYGMLLYGANSVGKSTLTKAVGLNLIMAQAGMYTACKLKYKPYNKIITRLSGEDALIQGKSSFVVEMSELRTILRNADDHSLVLGDELCRGTESASGTGLTIATILELVNRKTSFIFSTHMHHLVNDSDIVALPKNTLRICHLVLRYDHEAKTLVYDRKLKEGPGESIYGLEVAMSLSIESAFISKAAEIRRRVLDQGDHLLNPQKSKYNKKVYLDSCNVCGKKPNGFGKLQTHHINEQSKADKNGFIEHYHKDSSFNLITICDTCHKNLHSNGLKIITEQTLSGNIFKMQSSTN